MTCRQAIGIKSPPRFELVEMHLHAPEIKHAKLVYWPPPHKPNYLAGPAARADLMPEVRSWLEDNAPGFTAGPSPIANFTVEIVFLTREHATLFTMFWL